MSSKNFYFLAISWKTNGGYSILAIYLYYGVEYMANSKKKEKDAASKKDTIILLIIGVAFGFAVGFGTMVLGGSESGEKNITKDILEIAAVIVFMYFSIALHIILHETGHLLGGFISGYQFISFRVFNLIFVKENGRLTTKKYGIAGTMGQCLMTPPGHSDGNFPYHLYNLSGGIMNFLCSGVLFLPYILLRDISSWVGIILIPLIGVGVFLGTANLIPLRMSGVANDGYNVVALNKNADARRAFYLALHVVASAAKGIRYKDMPAEWSELPEDCNDPLTVTIALNHFNYLMDTHDFEAAKELAGKIVTEADKILEVYKNELRCELLFLEIIGERRQEEIERLYTGKLKKYIKASGSHLSKRRLMYAYSKLVTRDEAEISKALNKLNKTFKSYPYSGEVELERELAGIIDELAKQVS